ncbi:Eukaryotic translation initiation factor 3 subunit 8 N-terminus family protein [Babesia bovis T2Bo]|uniref:Eukaryotic translation initiation factor 3 subunit C n=1 Tax=Babesia bovis TaxID=5865 RepID=A7APB4_BABBO|nr:Eukaryotic translation initiation factor 3 subunit 8 N-terminus family protein [Babesia bovis T2Bo]EDO08398.1 Eukaryotic translation initiation factor 3 subunit 8 N-terminus family protein [Babesia bovis T2Bo]|eukprot:XP_001611966.1 eukaryotic translation initiation factor 3 subunit 8 [Babesia bovis T2Bo]
MASNVQSKFWGEDSDDSYSDSSGYSSEVSERDAQKRPGAAAAWVASDSSSDDDENRVVKSARAKALEAIQNIGKALDHHKTISDYSEVLKDYDNLARLVEKQYSRGRIPKLIVQIIVELQEFIDEKQKDKDSLKKMSKARSISFNTLKSRLRKFNEQYAAVVDEYNKDPSSYVDILKESSDEDYDSDDMDDSDDDDEDTEESSEESSVEEESASEDESEQASAVDAEDDDGGDEDSEEDSDYSDWSDSDASSISDADAGDKHKSALAKWGVKKVDSAPKVQKPKVASKKPKGKVVKKKEERPVVPSGVGIMHTVSQVADVIVPILEKADLGAADNPFSLSTPEINAVISQVMVSADSVRSYVKSIVERRGKRGGNTAETIRHLKVLPYIAKGISHSLYIFVVETLLHIEFDSYSNAYGAMTPKQWIDSYRIVSHLIDELRRHPHALLSSETIESDDPNGAESPNERDPANAGVSREERIQRSMTILESVVRKLNDELYKGLLYIEVGSDDYNTMLVYNVNMLYLLHKTLLYCLSKGKETITHAANIAIIMLEHLHYKDDVVSGKIWELVRQKVTDEEQFKVYFPDDNKKASDIVEELAYFVFEHGSPREKIRACLYLAFNKSLHGLYYEAKDLLLTPNIHDLAMETSITTQILLNRNIAQLGICAFRKGLISEAHSYLMDLCSQNRHKELLAQGLSMVKGHEKPPEQERAEKRRLLPYHMHLNIELIETVNNICACLLESANLAKSSLNSREIISRQFRRMYEMHEKQVFMGPPENNRDVVMSTFRHLQNGNWKECYDLLAGLTIWNRLPDREEVLQILKDRIKVEAFNTYIFKYVPVYDSFSVDQLSSMFDLDNNVIHSLLSKMIITGDIHATWDDSSKYCLINHTEPTDLQKCAIKLAENLTTAVEQNEMTLNMKNPKFALSQDRRFQTRENKFSYGRSRDDRHHAAPTFNRNRRPIQGARLHR